MPDFSFQGEGARIASVRDGTPAAEAGLKGQDIIIAIDEMEVKDLRSYSNAIKAHAPGETVKVYVLRNGEKLEFEVTLMER